ncbi:coproporphyrinogen III oxidase [Bacillus sp. FJAT-27916]|uniref:radical SAM family heme chaperone HemW n=1 Tax=Bacillaceae TaxID=186817 RepID=UPI0006710F47|nr:radical SAM family heme chaperone HemW [Bacillus sp. FJAT-27916]KMY43709.1 coproporphyrinogen III oxidase [Bacillus sp. FJAT-27916]
MAQSMYVHIPFCTQICHYCDFNKFFIQNQPVEEYLRSLAGEMSLYQMGKREMKTVFIGGGTPTALDAGQMEKLLASIHENIRLGDEYEFTMEANPGDLTKEKLAVMKAAGVNRLSLGVQTFNEELLKKIGRGHTSEDVYRNIELAREAGFENISIDLIYSLPGQTIEDLQDTINRALELELPHFSAYSLIIEPKTVFYIMLNKGKLSLPSEDTEASMYEYVMERMEKAGYHQYEISNFGKPGFESKHNLVYWNNEEYYGLGAGAHGYLNGVRYHNHGPLKKYMNDIANGEKPIIDQANVTKKERMEEEMFLGLRKTEGVSIQGFKQRFGIDMNDVFGEAIANFLQKELLVIEGGNIKLTHQGKLIGNEVFQDFLL